MTEVEVTMHRDMVEISFLGSDLHHWLSYSAALNLLEQLKQVALASNSLEEWNIIALDLKSGDFLWDSEIVRIERYADMTHVRFVNQAYADIPNTTSLCVQRKIT